jgi:hypothetical protein
MENEIRRLHRVCRLKDTAINYALTLINAMRKGSTTNDQYINEAIEDIKSYLG